MSSEPESPDAEVNGLENALASLQPARSGVDRDRVMFEAGQAAAAARSGRRVWMAIAAGFGMLALGEAVAIVARPATVRERVTVMRVPAPTQAVSPRPTPAAHTEAPASTDDAEPPTTLGRTEYERLTGQVLRYGLDGLPAPPSAALAHSEPRPAPTRARLQEEFLNVLDLGDPS